MDTSRNHVFLLPRPSPTSFMLKTPATLSATQQIDFGSISSPASPAGVGLQNAVSPELSKADFVSV